jgi:cytochrome c556
VVTYGGALLLSFLGGAAIRLWNKTEEAAEKAGEAAVDRAWERLAELGKESGENPADVEEAEQVQSLREAASALDALSQQIAGSYLEEFLAAGKEAVEERLRQDHFPAAKSRRIADAIADEIRTRLQQ